MMREDTVQRVLELLSQQPLSKALAASLHLANISGNHNLGKWLKLEMNGYWATNEAFADNVRVPEYRKVAGQHYDRFRRPLIVDQRLDFINEIPLRQGVEELEAMLLRAQEYTIQDPEINKMVRNELGIAIIGFSFSSIEIHRVLSSIRTKLIEHLSELPVNNSSRAKPHGAEKGDEVIQLKPNIYGIGFDLKALYRKWRKYLQTKQEK